MKEQLSLHKIIKNSLERNLGLTFVNADNSYRLLIIYYVWPSRCSDGTKKDGAEAGEVRAEDTKVLSRLLYQLSHTAQRLKRPWEWLRSTRAEYEHILSTENSTLTIYNLVLLYLINLSVYYS